MSNTPCWHPGCGHGRADHEPDVGCLLCDCTAYMDWPLPAAILPYGGTSGHALAPSSRDAVVARDKDGRTRTQQQETREYLRAVGTAGLTWRELDGWTHAGHGTCSRVLSDLHKAGKAERLTERRRNCAVYVLPEHVNGRETEQQGRGKRDLLTPAERSVVFAAGVAPDDVPPAEVRTLVAIIDRLAPEPMDMR